VFVRREPSGKLQIPALRAVRERLATATTMGKAGCGSQTRCITADAARAAIVQSLATTAPNKRNNVAKALLDALCDGGFLKAGAHHGGDGWVWQVS